jgi:orotidine-5'-phosphate decarboxylase
VETGPAVLDAKCTDVPQTASAHAELSNDGF